MNYRIGTRGSRLALAQAEQIREQLQKKWPEHHFEIRVIQTRGDDIQDKPLDAIGGKGIFVREIEEELLAGKIQMAVHSMKDMPAVPAPGLIFTGCVKREDARDVLILREASSLAELPDGAVIGTGSIRRKAQLLRLRPDLHVVGIRGNIDTRIRKMQEQKLDGIVLAAAGIHRLGLQEKITQYLDYDQMLPAPAQGVLALEICEGDIEIQTVLEALSDEESTRTSSVERQFLKLCGGDCHTPTAAVCERVSGGYRFRAMMGKPDGTDLVFADVQGKQTDGLALEAFNQMKKSKTGTVWLVGAGPGDPQLLTRRGAALLKRADCVVYDRLISTELLELTPVECEKIYVGKRNHHHSMKQEDIQKLLIEKAKEYSCVVRLKGGDPYVFGRGGEEALALALAGIECEVVPGISSAISGPALAGIPVTHRGLAGGFRVLTAHDRRDRLAAIDFESIARGTETCIFLMGLSNLEEIVNGLLRAGMPADKKAAVISNASTDKQKCCIAALENIVCSARKENLESPAIIVVGDVVGLADRLPKMKTAKVLVPKIGSAESPLAARLRQKSILVDEIQVGEISYLDERIKKEELEKAAWLVFTSKHGVHGFMRQLLSSGLDARTLAHLQIAVVGKKTALILRQYGLAADFTASAADKKTLFAELGSRVEKGAVIWYVNGIGNSLPDNAPPCWLERNVYVNREMPEITIEHPEDYDTVIFTCASSAERLTKRLPDGIPQKWQENGVFSIGATCTEKMRQFSYKKIFQPETAGISELADEFFTKTLYNKQERVK
jgi:uroporphyrinogen III methyltransferase/synthase